MDNTYTLENKYSISMGDQDRNFSLKPAALLNLLQDMGAKNIDGTDFGRKELLEQNLGWFLVRYRIEFDKYPSNIEEIICKTENRGVNKLNAYREFNAWDLNNNRILKAMSSWMMVDLTTKSLVNIEQKFPSIKKFEKRETDPQLNKLKSLTSWDTLEKFKVGYYDLDMNGHVNNTIYITWALEALGFDFLSTNTIKNIDIYYKHEVKYGDKVLSLAKVENHTSFHLIKNEQTQDEVCLMKFDFK